MEPNVINQVSKMIEDMPVISSHEHHLPAEMQQTMNLDRVLDYSYIGWYAGRKGRVFADSIQQDPLLQVHVRESKYFLPDNNWSKDANELASERQQFLDRFGYNSYWVWLEKGIQKIYGIADSITPENWEEISNRISQRHIKPGVDLEIMRNDGKYLRAVQDTYWDYGSDLGHPEFFSPTMRVDMFMACYNPEVLDHDLNSPFKSYPNAPTENFDDYLDFLKELFFKLAR